MTKRVDFSFEDPWPSWLADSEQEVIGTVVSNVHIRLVNSTTIEVPASAGDGQAVLPFNGPWRYNTVTKQRAHPGGAAGTYDIFATAKNDSIAAPADNTDYNWSLDIKATGSTPTIVPDVVDRYRLIGQLSWDGAAITDLRPAVDSVRATDPLRPVATLDTSVPLEVSGKSSSHSADLLRIRKNVGGTVAYSLSAAGAVTALGGGTFGGALAVTGGGSFSGTVNAAAYTVASTALAASHLSNGVTGSGAVALASSPALLGVPTAPTATAGTNTAQVATTAFVTAAVAAVSGGGPFAPLASPTFTGTVTIPTLSMPTTGTISIGTAVISRQVAGSSVAVGITPNARVHGTIAQLPRYSWHVTDAAANRGKWQLYSGSSGLFLTSLNDAENAEYAVLSFLGRTTDTTVASASFFEGGGVPTVISNAGDTSVGRSLVRPIRTSFPTTGLVEGMEVLIQTSAMATDGIPPWVFRYRSGISGSWKWEAIGPAPWNKKWRGTSGGAATTSYSAVGQISGDNVSLTVPLGGIYLVRWGFRSSYASSGSPSQESYLVPVMPGDARTQLQMDADAIWSIWTNSADASHDRTRNAECKVTVGTGGAAIALCQRHPNPIAWEIYDPWMTVTPLQCYN